MVESIVLECYEHGQEREDWKRAQVICIHEVFSIALVLVKTAILG